MVKQMNVKLLNKELEQIKSVQADGFFVTIFWITSTNARAERITWLTNNGYIRRNRQSEHDAFPVCVFEVLKDLKVNL